jgi:hypothetical protein
MVAVAVWELGRHVRKIKVLEVRRVRGMMEKRPMKDRVVEGVEERVDD